MKHIFLSSLLWSAMLVLTGCANLKNSENQIHYKEISTQAVTSEVDTAVPSGMSKIYLFMSDTPAGVAVMNIPPRAVIFGNSLVSFMPHPSHIVLTLPPGKYSIKNLQKVGSWWRTRIEETITLESDMVAFYEQRMGMFGDKLTKLDVRSANQLISSYPTARTLHAPYYMAETIPNHFVLSPTPIEAKPAKNSNNSQSVSSPPILSSETISDFFAVAGAIALVALMIYGMGAASVAAMPTLPPPNPSLINPPARTFSVPSIPTSVRSASGRTMTLEQRQGAGTIYNVSTGVRYRIEGDNIIGTDGSRFRSAGSTIFSHNGNYYTRSGNVITSNDGRQCQIIGSLIDCK
jgi:hypothetical protein